MKTTYLKTIIFSSLILLASCSKDDGITENNTDPENQTVEESINAEGNNSISFTIDGEDVLMTEYAVSFSEFETSKNLSINGTIEKEENFTLGTTLSILTDVNKIHTDPNAFFITYKDTTYAAGSDSSLRIDVTENTENSYKATFSGTLRRDFFVSSGGDEETFTKTIENGIIDINAVDTYFEFGDFNVPESKNILKAKIDGEVVWFYGLIVLQSDTTVPNPRTRIFFNASTEKTIDRGISIDFDLGETGTVIPSDFRYSERFNNFNIEEDSENTNINFEVSKNDNESIIATFSGTVVSRLNISGTIIEEFRTIEEGYLEYYY